jgi:hypothetical protein
VIVFSNDPLQLKICCFGLWGQLPTRDNIMA